MYKEKPVVIDLFCGAGGISEGLRQAGYHIACGVDIDKEAGETFKENFPESKFLLKDLKELTSKELLDECNLNKEDVELIVGGPPCQGFSMAGKRFVDDPRNVLFKEFVRIVNDLRPISFIMENVVGLVTMAKGRFKDEIIQSFKEIGYNVEVQIMNTADYGVPQTRKRTIFIGTRLDKPITFPETTHSNKKDDMKLNYVTVGEAIDDLPPLGEDSGEDIMEHNLTANSLYQRYMRGEITYEQWIQQSKEMEGKV